MPEPDGCLPGDEYLIPPLVVDSACERCGCPRARQRYDSVWGIVMLRCLGCGVEADASMVRRSAPRP